MRDERAAGDEVVLVREERGEVAAGREDGPGRQVEAAFAERQARDRPGLGGEILAEEAELEGLLDPPPEVGQDSGDETRGRGAEEVDHAACRGES